MRLARRAGISHTTVADIVSGQRQPTWDFCAAIAEPLGLTSVEVFRKAGLLQQSENDDINLTVVTIGPQVHRYLPSLSDLQQQILTLLGFSTDIYTNPIGNSSIPP